jgi:hypothetical protein
VTSEKLCDSIYKINYPDKKYSVLLVYYCNESSTKIWNYKPKEINRLSEKFICEILNIDNKDIIDSDIIKWKNGCNYITYNAYNNFHKNYLCATKNIFLTGDYFFWEKHYKLPLGMAAAVFSGQQTSFLIKMMKAY